MFRSFAIDLATVISSTALPSHDCGNDERGPYASLPCCHCRGTDHAHSECPENMPTIEELEDYADTEDNVTSNYCHTCDVWHTGNGECPELARREQEVKASPPRPNLSSYSRRLTRHSTLESSKDEKTSARFLDSTKSTTPNLHPFFNPPEEPANQILCSFLTPLKNPTDQGQATSSSTPRRNVSSFLTFPQRPTTLSPTAIPSQQPNPRIITAPSQQPTPHVTTSPPQQPTPHVTISPPQQPTSRIEPAPLQHPIPQTTRIPSQQPVPPITVFPPGSVNDQILAHVLRLKHIAYRHLIAIAPRIQQQGYTYFNEDGVKPYYAQGYELGCTDCGCEARVLDTDLDMFMCGGDIYLEFTKAARMKMCELVEVRCRCFEGVGGLSCLVWGIRV